jgi:phage gpG-like protein
MSVLRTFSSMSAFADHLLERQALVTLELRRCLGDVAEAIQETAKGELGHYQAAIGPFDAWQELADSTKEDRVQQGYTENDPLLRSGEMRESIKNRVSGLEAVIGSAKDEAVWMELGTTKAPPRPFLGPAIFHNEELIKEVLGAALVTGILGHGVRMPTAMTSRRISR